ncbi:MAG: hypothetical protein J0L77_03005 [Alphaproteobacteria bacterium]|nr:hypothetical protein [Alphaproteobacteria bacterium]
MSLSPKTVAMLGAGATLAALFSPGAVNDAEAQVIRFGNRNFNVTIGIPGLGAPGRYPYGGYGYGPRPGTCADGLPPVKLRGNRAVCRENLRGDDLYRPQPRYIQPQPHFYVPPQRQYRQPPSRTPRCLMQQRLPGNRAHCLRWGSNSFNDVSGVMASIEIPASYDVSMNVTFQEPDFAPQHG